MLPDTRHLGHIICQKHITYMYLWGTIRQTSTKRRSTKQACILQKNVNHEKQWKAEGLFQVERPKKWQLNVMHNSRLGEKSL